VPSGYSFYLTGLLLLIAYFDNFVERIMSKKMPCLQRKYYSIIKILLLDNFVEYIAVFGN